MVGYLHKPSLDLTLLKLKISRPLFYINKHLTCLSVVSTFPPLIVDLLFNIRDGILDFLSDTATPSPAPSLPSTGSTPPPSCASSGSSCPGSPPPPALAQPQVGQAHHYQEPQRGCVAQLSLGARGARAEVHELTSLLCGFVWNVRGLKSIKFDGCLCPLPVIDVSTTVSPFDCQFALKTIIAQSPVLPAQLTEVFWRVACKVKHLHLVALSHRNWDAVDCQPLNWLLPNLVKLIAKVRLPKIQGHIPPLPRGLLLSVLASCDKLHKLTIYIELLGPLDQTIPPLPLLAILRLLRLGPKYDQHLVDPQGLNVMLVTTLPALAKVWLLF